MRNISITPAWIKQIDATLIPWLQDQLHPVDEKGKSLDINDATCLNLSFGADSVNVKIPSGALVDHENQKWYETCFTANKASDEMPEGLRATLNSFLSQYNEEYENLRRFDDALNKAGIPMTVSDFTNGYLGLLLGSDWRLIWDWDTLRINEDEWGAEPSDIRITIGPDGVVSFCEPDDDGMVLPDRKVDSPKKLVEMLTQLANALSWEMGSQKSIDELNGIFGLGDPSGKRSDS